MMLRTALPLLLLAGGGAAGLVELRRQRAVQLPPPEPPPRTIRPGMRQLLRPLRFPGHITKPLLPPKRQRPRLGGMFAGSPLGTFGLNTADEYPAPYRYADALEIARITLNAAAETSPINKPLLYLLQARYRAIKASHVPNWRKTYALIMTIIFPAFAQNLLWHWYRDAGGFSSVKQERFNAIISWASLFLTMPATATAAATIRVDKGFSSLLPSFSPYLRSSTRLKRGNLNTKQMRRCLYDIYGWMAVARIKHGRGSTSITKTVIHAQTRMANLAKIYPLTDSEAFLIQGNLKAIDEITWFANAIVQGSISVNFDEGQAYVALAVKIVAAVASAAGMFVGPQVGAAISAAADAIGTLATLVASGQVSSTQLQAMAGAGVSMMMSQAGIRLGLESQIADLKAAGAKGM